MDGRRPGVLSRFISYLRAALSADVYIGVQSLHTSSGDFVLVGESGFEFGLVAFRLWELLFQSRPFEVVLGGGGVVFHHERVLEP